VVDVRWTDAMPHPTPEPESIEEADDTNDIGGDIHATVQSLVTGKLQTDRTSRYAYFEAEELIII
jgi:hypothetical protein